MPPPYSWPGPRENAVDRSGRSPGWRMWVNLIVCALSFLELGGKGVAPESCVVGAPLSPIQLQTVARIERLLEPWSGVTCRFTPDVVGRVVDKFLIVSRIFSLLAPWAVWLRHTLDPYAKIFLKAPPALASSMSALSRLRMKALKAARVRFNKGLGRFWPSGLLSENSMAAYIDPRVMRKADPPPLTICGDFCSPEEKPKRWLSFGCGTRRVSWN